MKPFETDGCSGGMSWAWRTFTGKPPPWEDLCREHDLAYWAGGDAEARLEADRRLRAGIAARRHPLWAWAVYAGVRVGGVWWLPLPWRWGFGHRWPRSRD